VQSGGRFVLSARTFPERDKNYVRYVLVGRHTVFGWLEDLGLLFIDELERVQRSTDVAGNIAEIGVHHGKLFILLALLRRADETAVAVDVFDDQHLNVDASGRGDRAALDGNLRRWHPDARGIVVHQADSRTMDGAALQSLAGGPCRLISVDGGHTADLTEHDLETAADALADGGIVILDDCFNALFPAVSEGAQRFLRRRQDVVAIGAAGNKTFLTQREHAERYRRAMAARADALGFYHQEHESFVGAPFHSVFPPDRQRAAHLAVRASRLYSRAIATRRRSS
jgi:hypothetical protein